jgi:molecular chaperone GrpE
MEKKQEKRTADKGPKACPEASKDIIEDIAQIKSELEQANAKSEEYECLLKRLQADYENFQKRSEKERYECARLAGAGLMVKLLPVIDTFDAALKDDRTRPVIEPLYKQLMDALHAEGLVPMDTLGKAFDPYRHEVLMQESLPDVEDGIIIAEIQKGYLLNSKILRHAKVKINRVKT